MDRIPEQSVPPGTVVDTPVLCPYCGSITPGFGSCRACGGRFDALSRQASQNAMGPWFIRDPRHPFRPGCSHATLRALLARGIVTRQSVLRGPTTHQFWNLAQRTPGVSHLLGVCHACLAPADPSEFSCGVCGATFPRIGDRQHMGLLPVRLLPGDAPPEAVAAWSWDAVGGEDHEAAGGHGRIERGAGGGSSGPRGGTSGERRAGEPPAAVGPGAARWTGVPVVATLAAACAGLAAMLVLSLLRGWLW